VPYRRVRGNGVTFVFKTEPGHPDLLHIYARHLTTEQDAVNTFFAADDRSVWNAAAERWETQSNTHLLYWFWLEEGSTVMVISCFRI
jgi:hypothetical protein